MRQASNIFRPDQLPVSYVDDGTLSAPVAGLMPDSCRIGEPSIRTGDRLADGGKVQKHLATLSLEHTIELNEGNFNGLTDPKLVIEVGGDEPQLPSWARESPLKNAEDALDQRGILEYLKRHLLTEEEDRLGLRSALVTDAATDTEGYLTARKLAIEQVRLKEKLVGQLLRRTGVFGGGGAVLGVVLTFLTNNPEVLIPTLAVAPATYMSYVYGCFVNKWNFPGPNRRLSPFRRRVLKAYYPDTKPEEFSQLFIPEEYSLDPKSPDFGPYKEHMELTGFRGSRWSAPEVPERVTMPLIAVYCGPKAGSFKYMQHVALRAACEAVWDKPEDLFDAVTYNRNVLEGSAYEQPEQDDGDRLVSSTVRRVDASRSDAPEPPEKSTDTELALRVRATRELSEQGLSPEYRTGGGEGDSTSTEGADKPGRAVESFPDTDKRLRELRELLVETSDESDVSTDTTETSEGSGQAAVATAVASGNRG